MTLNRAEALAGIVLSIALAILPVIGNFDWTSTAGVLAGIAAVLGIVAKRLDGHQKWEALTINAPAADQPVEPPPLNIKPVPPPGEPT
jgi:hypothetical protein